MQLKTYMNIWLGRRLIMLESPTIHHLNTLALGLQLGGYLQMEGETGDQSIERMLESLLETVVTTPMTPYIRQQI